MENYSPNLTYVLKIAIEIVSFPMKMVIFHSPVNVYQRVEQFSIETL